jgi:heparanase
MSAGVFALSLAPGVSPGDAVTQAALVVAYGASPPTPPPTGAPVRVSVDRRRGLSHVDARFLSVALDTSQVLGGHWWTPGAARVEMGRGSRVVDPFDLEAPRLRLLAAALAPAYLRIGGTEADAVYYDMGPEPSAIPDGFELSLTRSRWDAIGRFARGAGFDLFFTVNAGPGPRGEDGRWSSANFSTLLTYAKASGGDVGVFELGNEVDAFWFTQGLRHQVSGRVYAGDLARFREAVRVVYPAAKVAGPAALYWPVIGRSPALVADFMGELLDADAPKPDIVTWHFYPQQSRRCPLATRRASLNRLLEPAALNEVARWGSDVQRLVADHAPDAAVWLGETGNAQCGGEPGVSDRFAGALWWVDELGLVARMGQPVVVRQTLAGSDYGLVDDQTLAPRPDYWASVLWKRLMGTTVLDVETSADDAFVRGYAHCAPAGDGGVTVLLVNLHRDTTARACFDDLPTDRAGAYAMTAPALDSGTALLNEAPLVFDGRQLPALDPVPAPVVNGCLTLAPASFVFLAVPDANAAACLSAPTPPGDTSIP